MNIITQSKYIFFLSLVILFSLLTTSPSTVIMSLCFTLLIIYCISKFTKLPTRLVIGTTLTYVLLSILLFTLQNYFISGWNGFSGPYAGIGTDDSRYFSAISRSDFYVPNAALGYSKWVHPFSEFLKVIYPFPIYHPLQIILHNLIGIVFLPILSVRLAEKINPNIETSNKKLIYIFILFCPFINSNSLILMRESWISSLIILGILTRIEKRWVVNILTLLLMFFLRPFSLLVYFAVLLPLELRRNKAAIVSFIILIFTSIIIVWTKIQDILISFGIQEIFRSSFVQEYLARLDSDSIISKIASQPIPINLILLPVFFFFLPFIDLSLFYNEQIIPRFYMEALLSPIYNIIPLTFLIGSLLSKLSKNHKDLLFGFLLALAIISIVSIQTRHKSMIQPLFFILAFIRPCHNKYNIYIVLALFILMNTLIIIAR